MIAAVGVAALLLTLPSWRRWPRRIRRAGGDEVLELAMLVALGIDAGLNLSSSLTWVRPHVHPELGAQLGSVLRAARLTGLATQLRAAPGPAAKLLAQVGRAVETGAALGPTLDSFVEQLTAQQRAEAAARMQRLPVKLLFPLALLMLPGLVLMLAGPALIEVLGRFAATR